MPSMFFFLSQIFDFFTLPSNLLLILGLLGLFALALRKMRLAISLVTVSMLGLATLGWLPVAPVALALLEERFPMPVDVEDIEGIVMLGGAVDAHTTIARTQPILNTAAEQITTVRVLAERFPDAKVLLSGGAGHGAEGGELTESDIAADLLIGMGMAPDRIELEEHSRNTCENAQWSASQQKMDAESRWLLVTSASHMPRAVACFRAVGAEIIPYPVDYRTGNLTSGDTPLSLSDGLALADLAAHEWIGLLLYRILGMTEEFFPAP